MYMYMYGIGIKTFIDLFISELAKYLSGCAALVSLDSRFPNLLFSMQH